VWVGAGREEKVVDGNVFAFVQRPFGLVLLQGLADQLDDHGRASLLERGADGRWTARPWLELPAQPYTPTGRFPREASSSPRAAVR
jgi:hypothetical protein